MDKSDEILEIVTFLKDKLTTVSEDVSILKADVDVLKNDVSVLKRDAGGLYNRLDDELDKRGKLEVRVGKLEEKVV